MPMEGPSPPAPLATERPSHMRMRGAGTDQGGRTGAPAGPGPSLGTPHVPGYLHGPGAKLTKLLPLQEPTRWMVTVTSLVPSKACPQGKLLYLSEGSPTSQAAILSPVGAGELGRSMRPHSPGHRLPRD